MPPLSKSHAGAAKSQDALLVLQPQVVPQSECERMIFEQGGQPKNIFAKPAPEACGIRIWAATAYFGTFTVTRFGGAMTLSQPDDTRQIEAVRDFCNVMNGNAGIEFPCSFAGCQDPALRQIGDGSLSFKLFFVDNVPYDSTKAMTSVLADALSGFGVREGFFNVEAYPREGMEKISKWLVFYSEYRNWQGGAIESQISGIPSSIYRSVIVKGMRDEHIFPDNPQNYKYSCLGVFFPTGREGAGDSSTTHYSGARFGDPRNDIFPGIRVDRIGLPEAAIRKSRVFSYPNPSSVGEAVTIEAISKKQGAVCTIFDLQGRQIRTLAGEDSGERRAYCWDGRDSRGQDTPSGIYFAKVEGQEKPVKIMRLK